jgi:hypothetical protein
MSGAWFGLPDSPACPTCGTTDTGWDGISADYDGDWWACADSDDHRFILTPEGRAFTPGGTS